jgi:hypothetical protein
MIVKIQADGHDYVFDRVRSVEYARKPIRESCEIPNHGGPATLLGGLHAREDMDLRRGDNSEGGIFPCLFVRMARDDTGIQTVWFNQVAYLMNDKGQTIERLTVGIPIATPQEQL